VSAPATPRHERRLLTVLFGDLVGFTSASDGADPEDIRARVRPFQDLVRREVGRTGGTVARVVGDGVMVVWGYPTAQEDDAPRAIRAALAIRDGVTALGDDMHVRLGINSGEAVVAFGSDDERADDAMGDAVNVAARLASAAPIDGIVVGEATATLAGPALRAESLAPLSLKGKAEPVPAFLVLGLASGRDAIGAGPFVGRGSELALLRDACATADTEGGTIRVLVTGEPGVGKSRLIAEIRRERLAAGSTLWLIGRCRADASAPAWALGEIVKGLAGIADDETTADALAKVEQLVPAGTVERDWIRDRLAQLAGAAGGTAPSADELGRVWAAFLEAIAGGRTIVLQIEDVHWADAELIAILLGTAIGSGHAAVVLLLTGRPEVLDTQPTLAAACRLHLSLSPLPADDSDELISTLAAGLDLAPADRLLMVGRSGGNPLFAGELVRLVAQGRLGAPAASGAALLPETVQAVIAARLDLLSPEHRSAARDAAVVGASFWRGAIEALGRVDGGSSDAIDEALQELVRLEFIRPRRETTLPGDAEYAFRHALVRDVAYGQLTRRDRAVRHAATAAWLAERAGPERGDLAGIVADHDLRALELAGATADTIDQQAVREHAWGYLMQAGTFASSVDARAAAARYRAAARVATRSDARLDALERLAAAELDAGSYADSVATADQGLQLAAELGRIESKGSLHLVRARARRPIGHETWFDDVRAAIDLLEAGPPTPTLVDAYAMQTLVEMMEGSGAALLNWADKAIAVAERLGIAPPAGALGRRGFARAMLGDPGGEDDLRRAIHIARREGDSHALANAVSDLGGAFVYRGDMAGAEAQVIEALDIARTRGLWGVEAQCLFNLAYVARVGGRFEETFARLEAVGAAVDGSQDRVRPFLVEYERAMAFESRGDTEIVDAMVAGISQSLPGQGWTTPAAMLEMLSAAHRGDAAAVRTAFEGVYLQQAEGDIDAADAINYPALARAAIAVGAIDIVERIRASVATRSRFGAAVESALHGLALAAAGLHVDSIPALRRAIAFMDAAGYRPEGAQLRAGLARSLAVIGQQAAAASALREASAAWQDMGAPGRVAECTAQLAALAAATR
jgi:class 3 adenylate cyclase/tetratricopeptide (TPR) repeat protein